MRLRPLQVVVLVQFVVLGAGAQSPTQTPGTIRTNITMVPVDVRVLDRRGNPVTDLTQDDFVLLEDDTPQAIRHFSAHTLTPDISSADPVLRFRSAPGPSIVAQNRRVFLVMLGRGRHQAVTKSVAALSRFVRERLMPQDRVALLAWNRATDFTSDHALIARTVDRYGERHEKIELGLREWFSGLRALYGSKDIPPQIQREIDSVFETAKALRPREMPPGPMTDLKGVDRDARRTADALMSHQIATERAGDSKLLSDASAEITAALVDIDFESYVAQASETWQDVGALFMGIEYLRHLEGEKHLVLFTESGLRLFRREDNERLAAAASDARIVLDTVQTGGTVGPAPPRMLPRGGIAIQTQPSPGAVFSQGFSVRDLRLIAELTGGQSSAYRHGDDALDRIDRTTRFQYLLGYYPSNPAWDGKFRRLTIKVKRPGLTVLYRHGYYASQRLVPLDRQQFLTSSRVYAAGTYGRPIEDLRLRLQPPTIAGTASAPELILEMNLDIAKVAFTPASDLHRATLRLAVFCGDAKQSLIHEAWRSLDLNLTDAARERMLRDGATFKVTVPAPGEVRHVKVVVYDYGSDLLGTAVARIR